MNYDTWVVLQNAIKGNSFLHCNDTYDRPLSPLSPFLYKRVRTADRRTVDAWRDCARMRQDGLTKAR
jgi:hypothetical protein